MTKFIFHPILKAVCQISPFFIAQTFADCHNDRAFFHHFFPHIKQELFHGKRTFTQIDQIRCHISIESCQSRRSCEPACILPHDFYHCNGRQCIYIAVTCNFCQCSTDIFCSRTKTGRMVCFRQIIFNGFWHTNDLDIINMMVPAVFG